MFKIYKPNKSGVGVRFMDSDNCQVGVRIDQGVKKPAQGSNRIIYPCQKVDHIVDHVRVTYGGQVIGRDGRAILRTDTVKKPARTPEAHIPLKEWLEWDKWYAPKDNNKK